MQVPLWVSGLLRVFAADCVVIILRLVHPEVVGILDWVALAEHHPSCYIGTVKYHDRYGRGAMRADGLLMIGCLTGRECAG
ncbi:hypothetical protein F4823DRAFT_607157 [Ustulina deusta]|nr:hypothetical protein F4823DRAFT_607157 [Ustulina deusta]